MSQSVAGCHAGIGGVLRHLRCEPSDPATTCIRIGSVLARVVQLVGGSVLGYRRLCLGARPLERERVGILAVTNFRQTRHCMIEEQLAHGPEASCRLVGDSRLSILLECSTERTLYITIRALYTCESVLYVVCSTVMERAISQPEWNQQLLTADADCWFTVLLCTSTVGGRAGSC